MRDGRRVDILLTHSPPRGIGDGDDPVHQGFDALNALAVRLQPALLLHGHVAPCDAVNPDRRLGGTVVCNVVGRHLIDIDPGTRTAELRTGAHRAR